MNRKYPFVLLGIYLLLFIILAINPYDRTVWFAENLPIMIIVALLVITYPKFQFSNTAYTLMSVLIILHTIGGHYTFARVPFEWFTDLFSFERNHYDRISHFSVGFYAYALAELLVKTKATSKKWVVFLMPLFFIGFVGAAYEIIEWQYAVNGDPDAGHEVLGSQGDIWDAQTDMFLDILGAFLALGIYFVQRKGDLQTLHHGKSNSK